MEKSRYYVNVQSKTVNTARDTAVFEWEIDADASDIVRLEELFEDLTEADEGPLGQFFQLGIGSDTERNESFYEDRLLSVYTQISLLATPETRQQLKQTGMLVV